MSEDLACTVCGSERPDATRVGLCLECRRKAGIVPSGAPLRPPSPCRRCAHREIVRVHMRERTSTALGESNDERVRPVALTWPLRTEFKALLSFDRVRSAAPDLSRGYGLLEAYVCRSCGLTEIFASHPEAIPIGPEYGTELMVVPGDGTYR